MSCRRRTGIPCAPRSTRPGTECLGYPSSPTCCGSLGTSGAPSEPRNRDRDTTADLCRQRPPFYLRSFILQLLPPFPFALRRTHALSCPQLFASSMSTSTACCISSNDVHSRGECGLCSPVERFG